MACKSASGTQSSRRLPACCEVQKGTRVQKLAAEAAATTAAAAAVATDAEFCLEVFEAKRRQALTAAKATTVPAHAAAAAAAATATGLEETVRVSG